MPKNAALFNSFGEISGLEENSVWFQSKREGTRKGRSLKSLIEDEAHHSVDEKWMSWNYKQLYKSGRIAQLSGFGPLPEHRFSGTVGEQVRSKFGVEGLNYLTWNQGRTYLNGHELLYYHFIDNKDWFNRYCKHLDRERLDQLLLSPRQINICLGEIHGQEVRLAEDLELDASTLFPENIEKVQVDQSTPPTS